jgi:hypothetical protein
MLCICRNASYLHGCCALRDEHFPASNPSLIWSFGMLDELPPSPQQQALYCYPLFGIAMLFKNLMVAC